MRNYGGREYAASLGGGIATFGEIVVVRVESEEAGRCTLQLISQTSQWFDWGRTKGNVEYLINSLQQQGMTFEHVSADSGHAIGRVARAMPSPPEMPS